LLGFNFLLDRSIIGCPQTTGTIETDKRADLVLLEKNPLKDITNSRKIAGVMIRGRWLSKTDLQKGLDEIAAFYETLKN